MKACSVSGMSVTKAYTVTQKSIATPPLPPPLVINPTPHSLPLTATSPPLPSPLLPPHPSPFATLMIMLNFVNLLCTSLKKGAAKFSLGH